jgi:tight adherence protein B
MGIVIATLCAGFAVWLITPSPAVLRLSARTLPVNRDPVRRIIVWLSAARTRISGRVGRDQQHRLRVIAAFTALASELRAGHPFEVALQHAGGDPCVWPTAIAAARFGADITQALRIDAKTHPAITALAACWQVGSVSGSGLARTVEELARSGRESEDTRAQLDAHLASARSSMRVLAALPFLGIAMGTILGATPITWFGTSPFGFAAMCSGLILTGIGLWWSRKITRSVERLL